ncbi:MAG TPA: hypothetical protein VHQ99_04345, partial [Gaiellaceae bacterium]|nr:hypothetical protein [Gaiellaceae bacterium]
MSELIDELLADAAERMHKSVEATNHEFSSVRTEPNSAFVASTDLCMRSSASASSSSISSLISRDHHRSHLFAGHYPLDVALVVHVEHVQRHMVLGAERKRRVVHDAQAASQRV